MFSRRRKRHAAVAAAAIATLVGALLSSAPAFAAAPECTAPTAGAPVFITDSCADPTYATPIVDSETEQTSPVAHRKVTGHFEGTNITFNIYLPPANQFKGRFYQYTYPLTDANATDRAIGFAIENGGYAVQAGAPTGVSLGYRHAAAAAKFAESYAATYYSTTPAQINGYLYGPSGGSFQTIGATENSSGVWQGFVPMVLGVPMSTPYNFFIRAGARFILADKADQISDAVLPGGSGDPYAGLDEGEAAMLRELVAFGIPLRGWEDPDYLLGITASDGLLGFAPIVKQIDPTYADDFWAKPGYLGTEQSPLGDAVRAALAAGGDRWDIALSFYHRYQLPPAAEGYTTYAQFRAADGTPLYPQRASVVGPLVTSGTSGGASYSGAINGKVIIVDNLLDVDAPAWHADWYAQRVAAKLGPTAFAQSFRLYLNESADHIEGPKTGASASRLIDYWGSVEQALRDLTVWVEQGKAAPASTKYTVTDGQFSVPKVAAVRRGEQPVVDVTANLKTDVLKTKVGKPVALAAVIQLPPGSGKVVSTEWDLTGTGQFSSKNFVGTSTVATSALVHKFTSPGTYFVSVRVTTQKGDAGSDFGRVQNIDRVRIVVQ